MTTERKEKRRSISTNTSALLFITMIPAISYLLPVDSLHPAVYHIWGAREKLYSDQYTSRRCAKIGMTHSFPAAIYAPEAQEKMGNLCNVIEPNGKEKACLTPASPFGFAGGNEESRRRKPEKNCGQIPDGRDQAAFASPSARTCMR
ncbi:MAG: hypothetical protein LLF89_04065 [Spirochaetaceae bacterium]|nr:hypothetical protein [Spirochaetaceae bacterium]